MPALARIAVALLRSGRCAAEHCSDRCWEGARRGARFAPRGPCGQPRAGMAGISDAQTRSRPRTQATIPRVFAGNGVSLAGGCAKEASSLTSLLRLARFRQ